jgi:hypothetical protein
VVGPETVLEPCKLYE